MFQHTAARRRLRPKSSNYRFDYVSFNTQPPEGGCLSKWNWLPCQFVGFNTQPPEGGCFKNLKLLFLVLVVSTHSRPKAAALESLTIQTIHAGFNTQPPEGGCGFNFSKPFVRLSFNTQPPEGGCSLHKKTRKISALNTVFR